MKQRLEALGMDVKFVFLTNVFEFVENRVNALFKAKSF